MAINIQQLLALLQQGAPQQGAVKPPGGDPPIPQLPDALVPPEMKANTVRPPGYVDPGVSLPGLTPKGKPNPIDALLGSESKQPPTTDPRTIMSARMPTTQSIGPKPMNMGGSPHSGMEGLLGFHRVGDEDSLLGKLGSLFPENKPLVEKHTQTRLLSSGTPGPGATPPTPPRDSGELVGPPTPKEQEPAQFAYPGQEHDMIQQAAAEFHEQSGANSPDQADEALRHEFQDDPEIESAIAHARMRYEGAKERSATPPGVMEYVGYVLATLAGADPMQAAEAISRRGEKRQDEHMALQDLLGAQGMKIKDRQMQRQMGAQQNMGAAKLLQDQLQDKQRQAERVDDRKFDRFKAGRGAALQELNQLRQQMQYSNNPDEKKALQEKIRTLEMRKGFFNRQLGEPEKDEDGNPIGMISPDAMRLMGLG